MARPRNIPRDSMVRGYNMNDYVVAVRFGTNVNLYDSEGASVTLEGYPGEGLYQRVLAFGPHLRGVTDHD